MGLFKITVKYSPLVNYEKDDEISKLDHIFIWERYELVEGELESIVLKETKSRKVKMLYSESAFLNFSTTEGDLLINPGEFLFGMFIHHKIGEGPYTHISIPAFDKRSKLPSSPMGHTGNV